MALINCPECKHEVSDTVKKCPNCGYAIKGNSEIAISTKIPIGISIIYAICVCIYAFDYLWTTTNIIMLIVAVGMIALMFVSGKIDKKVQGYIFLVTYIVGAFVTVFEYNISRMDLEGGFFSSYTYSDSLGLFLAIYQVVAVVSVILLCTTMIIPQISLKYSAILLFVSGIIGMVFQIYDKIYLSDKWGTATNSTFYIWLGIVTLCFFMVGVAYLMAYRNTQKE